MLARPLCTDTYSYSKHGETVRVWLCNSILGQSPELQTYILLIPDTAANCNSLALHVVHIHVCVW